MNKVVGVTEMVADPLQRGGERRLEPVRDHLAAINTLLGQEIGESDGHFILL